MREEDSGGGNCNNKINEISQHTYTTHEHFIIIIWMRNLFIVTATNSFAKHKLKATPSRHTEAQSPVANNTSIMCERMLLNIFNINNTKRKNVQLEKKLQPCCCAFIYSFFSPFPRFIDIILPFHCDFCGWLKFKIFICLHRSQKMDDFLLLLLLQIINAQVQINFEIRLIN